MWQRVAALDGVRGLAILFVVASHAQWPGTKGAGTAGVTLFFVLSGYLITGLLREEIRTTGALRVGRFWARRAIRLMPALVVLLVTGSVQLLALGASVGYVGSGVFWCLSYAMNWAMAAGLYPGPMSFAWSLAVEEQFYLLWPFALPLLLRTKKPIWWLLAVAAGSATLRVLMYASGAWSQWRVIAGTDVNAYALLLGAALALWRTDRVRLPAWSAPVALSCFIGTFLVENLVSERVATLWALSPVFALVGVWLVAAAADDPRWLRARGLTYLGSVSYGWYLWHSPLEATVEKQGGGAVIATVVALVALGLAALSRRYVERPFSAWARARLSDGAMDGATRHPIAAA